mmetsp:Transcript_106950/g.300766  ORF Transcript_106950/g.300766 Transcript_106950/m.300766 type:complete len:282 (+) Transcript_106950:82-927(+)|eukprot:CAMPEP_0117575762 /NCGR_PEP_ID=MMETSP0784-20121206/62400_1 /TAXON_ID=39447 /ORGANISM="" /LENGTH=281 /DNA_ID=CAMNT_0005374895 /DNA_START=27 /DNA_END=872 /DNA_ORIENTATION=-
MNTPRRMWSLRACKASMSAFRGSPDAMAAAARPATTMVFDANCGRHSWAARGVLSRCLSSVGCTTTRRYGSPVCDEPAELCHATFQESVAQVVKGPRHAKSSQGVDPCDDGESGLGIGLLPSHPFHAAVRASLRPGAGGDGDPVNHDAGDKGDGRRPTGTVDTSRPVAGTESMGLARPARCHLEALANWVLAVEAKTASAVWRSKLRARATSSACCAAIRNPRSSPLAFNSMRDAGVKLAPIDCSAATPVAFVARPNLAFGHPRCDSVTQQDSKASADFAR